MTGQANGREHLSLADVARRTAVIIAVAGGGLLIAVIVFDLRTILLSLLIAALFAVTVAPPSPGSNDAASRAGSAPASSPSPSRSRSVRSWWRSRSRSSPVRGLLGNLPHIAHDLFKPGGPLAFTDRRFHIERRIGVVTPGPLFDLVAGPRSLVYLFTRTAEMIAAVVTIVTLTVMLLMEGPHPGRH